MTTHIQPQPDPAENKLPYCWPTFIGMIREAHKAELAQSQDQAINAFAKIVPEEVFDTIPALDQDALLEGVKKHIETQFHTLSGQAEPLLQDMVDRHQQGIEKYGTGLQPFNGRNALADLYQEILDGIVYSQQAIMELQEDPTTYPVEVASVEHVQRRLYSIAIGIKKALVDMEGKADPQ